MRDSFRGNMQSSGFTPAGRAMRVELAPKSKAPEQWRVPGPGGRRMFMASSNPPRRPLRDGEHAIGLVIVNELLGPGVPLQCSAQLFGDAPQKQCAGRAMSHARIADGGLARAN